MVDSVTFPEELGGDGETYSSGNDPITGLGNGGYLTRFFKILANIINLSAFTKTSAASAAASALTALNAPGTICTSTSNRTITDAGSVTFEVQAGKSITQGMAMRAAVDGAAATTWMEGIVTAYDGVSGDLTIAMTAKGIVEGAFNNWHISLSATGAGAVNSAREIATTGLLTGGGDFTEDRTFDVPAATLAEARALASMTKALTPGQLGASLDLQQVDDAAVIDNDLSLKPNFYVILAGIRTINRFTGGQKGRWYYGELWQDETGNRTVAWDGAYNHRRTGTPLLSTSPNARDAVAMLCTDDTPAANTFDVYFSRAE
ncbi:hypothetical protein [Phenylobacterium sp.]|uniref:hypothetical protein n=1 Tax=Phenylobacterium sp. TaxID=1871053 RepID=UPI0035B41C5E